MAAAMQNTRITAPEIHSRKASADATVQRISALTAYDFTIARILDQSGVDVILVGDSLGMVVQGESTTLPVTLDQMVYHTRCVTRGVSRALVVADLPFLSYQVSLERAVESAGRLLKEGGAAAVKLEGGVAISETVKRLVELDIPVMGHVGMTPQSIHRMGGFKQQGRTHREGAKFAPGSWEQVLEDAHAIEKAGAFSVVLEGVAADLAARITKELTIPTIGIAAGEHCDGEVLVSYDLLGLTLDLCPPFVKQRAALGVDALTAAQSFVDRVRSASTLRRTTTQAA